jgi:dihydroflavonol-4-reductase
LFDAPCYLDTPDQGSVTMRDVDMSERQGGGLADKILLTGIRGYVGRHAALTLLRAGLQVCGCLRRLTQAEEVRAALRPHLSPEAMDRLCFVEVDLLSDDAWAAAMVDIGMVVHTAAPFVIEEPADPQDLIRPTVEGTLRVMRMARASGVKRMIMVSSTAAMMHPRRKGVQTEEDWGEEDSVSVYTRAKILAERAAWEFAAQQGVDLTVVNPGLILGPPLGESYGASVGVIRRLLRGRDPMMPLLGIVMVDVRDVAEALLRVLQRPDVAVGKRYAVVSGLMTLPNIGRLLKETYPRRRIATMQAPIWLLRLYALWDPEVAAILPNVGVLPELSNAKARAELGMAFIPPGESVKATAEWLLEKRVV